MIESLCGASAKAMQTIASAFRKSGGEAKYRQFVMSFFGGFSLSPMATRALYASDQQEGEAPASEKVLAESQGEDEQVQTDQGSSGVEDVPSAPGGIQTSVKPPQRKISLSCLPT